MAKSAVASALLASILLLLLILPANIFSSEPALADIPEVKWSKVGIPTQGEVGKWVLARGSDVSRIAIADDGTLYACATATETAEVLFKSVDGGITWSATGGVTGVITGIATASGNPNVVYYATAGNVYRSADAGLTFVPLPPNPGGAGSNNIVITSIAAAHQGNSNTVIVATMDTDAGEYGGVYVLDESRMVPLWQDTAIGGYDVLAVAISPGFAADRQVVAVATDETDTIVTSSVSNTPWGQVVNRAVIAGAASSASIGFPDDYVASAQSPAFFVALNTRTGAGDVYRISGRSGQPTLVDDLNAQACSGLNNFDVGALTVSGNSTSAHLIAGTAGGTEIYVSQDSGTTWKKSSKQPTGQAVTSMVAWVDGAGTRRTYAATSGRESAVSVSTDGGISWNQAGLIDTEIGANAIIDVTVSPNCSENQTLFMLTWGGEHSLWRSVDSARSWERVFCGALPDVDTLRFVEISPKYGQGAKVVYLTGSAQGTPALWRSKDGGQTFVRRFIPFSVDAWVVLDDKNIYLGGYDGHNALVCSSQDGGFIYSRPVTSGGQSIKSIAVSPDFQTDKTLLVGNTTGLVFLSTDNATSFKKLGLKLPTSGAGAAQVAVAFDPEFSRNKTVYAASDTPSTTSSQNRIFRFKFGKSEDWESIDSTLPVGSIIGQIASAPDGTLYAVSSKAVASSIPLGGAERSLNPTFSLTPTFETVVDGLDDRATLYGLWLSENQLWSIDTTNTRLMTYVDTLTRRVELISPADKAPGVEINGVRLQWKMLPGATTYEWQLDYDDSFSALPDAFDGSTEGSSCRLPPLEMATTYYWRIRATAPVPSPWSAKSSFTTKLGNAVVAPQLQSPAAGATGVPPQPAFEWSAIALAESYELLVSSNVSFVDLVFDRSGVNAVAATAWQSDVGLEYGTTYYWKVRALGAGSNSAWSDVGTFTIQPAAPRQTSSPPTPSPMSVPVTAPPPAAPAVTIVPPPPSPSFPAWLLYGVGIVGLILIALLVAILLVLVRRK